MSYTPYTWSSGDTVTAARLNNIEQGVANAGGGGFKITISMDGDLWTLDKTYTEIRNALLSGYTPVVISPFSTDDRKLLLSVIEIGEDSGNYYVMVSNLTFIEPYEFSSNSADGTMSYLDE